MIATRNSMSFRANNRAQLDAVQRITRTYRLIADAGKRDAIRKEAERLGLVPPGTSDDAFARGKLQDSAVGAFARSPRSSESSRASRRRSHAERRRLRWARSNSGSSRIRIPRPR